MNFIDGTMDILSWNLFIEVYKYTSTYLALSILLSVSSIVFIWIYERPEVHRFLHKHVLNPAGDTVCEEPSSEPLTNLRADEDSNVIDLANLKSLRHQNLVEQIASDMTTEQLEAEKEVEKAQLQAIFSLLREQEEKFQVTSIEELQEQMRLYR